MRPTHAVPSPAEIEAPYGGRHAEPNRLPGAHAAPLRGEARAVSLDDLAGEVLPLHLAGIASDRHPGWQRRMQRRSRS